jgi:DNA invertase Pin-like site-specific DNA recombinase
VTELRIGYARVSTVDQDLTAQRDALTALGVDPKRIYVDHGLTGTNRGRPGLREALAACRQGDTLVVTKLDRLARSVPDARDIVDELTTGGVRLNIGGSVHDPTDPIGRLLFTTLSMIAEFEADLARARTREGTAVARAKGRLRGKQPKLSPRQEAHLVELYHAGEHTIGELEEPFPVTRSTIYRALARAPAAARPQRQSAARADRHRQRGSRLATTPIHLACSQVTKTTRSVPSPTARVAARSRATPSHKTTPGAAASRPGLTLTGVPMPAVAGASLCALTSAAPRYRGHTESAFVEQKRLVDALG